MHWQDFIDIRINYENNLPRLVTDQTGVLSSSAYLKWLSEKNIEAKISDNFREIRFLVDEEKQVLIITTKENIPAFISNKVEHIVFSYSDLPLNGNIHHALKKTDTWEIIDILDYVFATNRHQVLAARNLNEILMKAKAFSNEKHLVVLNGKIRDILQQEPNPENILTLGKLWASLTYQSIKTENSNYLELIPQIDAFSDHFIESSGMEQAFYASTNKKPKTVEKILANIKSDKQDKIALLCFDCMGFVEWLELKDFLSEKNYVLEEKAIFALLPTLTSISRSAIFQGNTDVYSLKYPGRSTEAKAFAHYFKDRHTKYFTEDDEITGDALLGYDYISILYNFIDELSHAAQFPPNSESKELFIKSIQAYLDKSSVLQDIEVLVKNDYQIYICSDHGSVVAKGNGKRSEKYLSNDFAKRAIIIKKDNEDLISEKKIKIPFVDKKLLVLPEGRTMFANKNKIEFNHGGITVEEMVVPYVKLKKV